MAFLVVYESNGMKRSGTFYARLKDMGLHLRSSSPKVNGGENRYNQENGIVASRYSEKKNAVILQEGCCICASESLARRIANIARSDGTENVFIGVVRLEAYFGATDADKDILERVDGIQKKKGRRTKSSVLTDFIVQCNECLAVKIVTGESNTVNCGECTSVNLTVQVAKKVTPYLIPADGDLYERWVRVRFASGSFFALSTEGAKKEPPPLESLKLKEQDKKIIDLLGRSEKLANELVAATGDNIETIFEFFDSIYCSKRYASESVRRDERADMIIKLMSNKVIGPQDFSLLGSKTKIDILDSLPVAEESKVYAMVRQIMLNK